MGEPRVENRITSAITSPVYFSSSETTRFLFEYNALKRGLSVDAYIDAALTDFQNENPVGEALLKRFLGEYLTADL